MIINKYDIDMDKLQELTERLYNEGLSKGREEGDAILAKAKAEAAETIAAAKAEAEKIVAEADKQAADLKAKVESDLKMAAAQCISAVKADVEKVVTAKIAGEPAKAALSDGKFVKEILKAVAEKFSDEAGDLAVVLPESLQKETEAYVKGELAKELGRGIDASFSKEIEGGFRIGPKDGSYFISFTDETFAELIGAYLRPTTKKLLFG